MAKHNLLNTEPDGALKKHLPPFFKSYPGLNKQEPSSFFLWSDNPPPDSVQFLKRICHADLMFIGQGYDHLVTAVPVADEIALAYIQMLILGPFKAFSDLISLHCVKENYYLLCSELSKWPANVLYNFCIATRVPIEFPHFLPYWKELVDKGFNTTLAFLLSYSTAGKPWNKVDGRAYPISGHLWIDTSSNWRSIINGEMTKMSPPFKEYPPGCKPCNTIWGYWNEYRQLWNMSNEEISAYLNLPIEVSEPPKKPRQLKDKIAEAGGINAYLEQLQAGAQQQVQQQAAQAPNNLHINVLPNFAPAHNNEHWVQLNADGDFIPAPPPQPVPMPPLHVEVDDDPLEDDDLEWGEDPDDDDFIEDDEDDVDDDF